MTSLFAKSLAFLRRDFFIATSYKFQFLFQLAGGLFIVATFYFVAKLMGSTASQTVLRSYKADYFSFVIVGLATNGFLFMGLSGIIERLRIAMTEGSLEMMFASSTSPVWIVVLPCLWGFLFEALRSCVVLFLAALLFGFHPAQANLVGFAGVLLVTVPAYSVFGLLSAALIMIFKRGDPINWAFAHASALLGGAYFPVEILPAWLKPMTALLPMTYAYHGLRMTMLAGARVVDVLPDIAVLVGFGAIGLPLSVAAIHSAVARAKRDGSLGQF